MALAIMLLSIPTYLTGCLEHPTCEVADPPPEPTPVLHQAAPPVTEAPPVPTTQAPPPPPTPTGWNGLLAEYWSGDNLAIAARILMCESGGDPRALNPSGAAGLMQIHHPSWGDVYGVTIEDLFDPGTNVAIAYDIWSKLGWSHGPVCR